MSSPSSSSKKPLWVTVLSVVAVAVAGYFGVELTSDNGGSSDPTRHANAGGSSAQMESCSIDTLPEEASETADDILAGGPYDYPENDNQHFGNYEGVLPQQDNDYYREYTVETPGLNHRGPLRIVTGGGSETDPDVWYYTDDHYESFCEIPDAE
ncbi:ribonuclease domain-containing protein [Corynebacterium camporealensis]|uniref:ribonuclease domain-containing protein n=1 Tax=Corynebacterium camporealensis TaxID=161896 RepID=UPI00052D3381|nr:ribonuclease domain-containing protein [Corynebacterium camporealensis]